MEYLDNTNFALLKKVEEVEEHKTRKGTPFWAEINKRLRAELLALLPRDKVSFVGKYVVEKQFNPVLNRVLLAIYNRESWQKHEGYNKYNSNGDVISNRKIKKIGKQIKRYDRQHKTYKDNVEINNLNVSQWIKSALINQRPENVREAEKRLLCKAAR